MDPHEPGVREHVVDRRQVEQVRRVLEHPAPSGPAEGQHLERGAQGPVVRPLVEGTQELEDSPALGTPAACISEWARMNVSSSSTSAYIGWMVSHVGLKFDVMANCRRVFRISAASVRSSTAKPACQPPELRTPVAGRSGQDVVGERGACARHTHHEDRCVHGLVSDLRVPSVQVTHHQPVPDAAVHQRLPRRPAERAQPGKVGERVQGQPEVVQVGRGFFGAQRRPATGGARDHPVEHGVGVPAGPRSGSQEQIGQAQRG